MLGDAYQEGTDKALSMLASKPLDPIAHEPKFSAWSVVPRGIVAAGAEIIGNLNDIAGAYGKSVAAYGAPSASPLGQSDTERSQSDQVRKQIEGGDPLFRDPSSATAYGFASDLRPDPVTAGAAENVFFGLTKGLTKAVGAGAALGPLGGGAVFGTSEGMTTAEDLAAQGVDQATRMKVGAVTGVMNAAMLAIPVAGQTIKQTLGYALASGPASFIAQQAASSKILEHANYNEIAQQYDPLDPVGLTVATLLPAVFGAYAMRGYKGAKNGTFKASDTPVDSVAQGQATDAATAQAVATVPTPDQIDAVMTHNLTLQQDVHDAVPKLKGQEFTDVLNAVVTGMRRQAGERRIVDTGIPEGVAHDRLVRAAMERRAALQPSQPSVDSVAQGQGADAATATVAAVRPIAAAVSERRVNAQFVEPAKLADISQNLETAGIKNAISENKGTITLSKIIVPKDQRGMGKGTEAMQTLTDYADQTGQRMVLSPSTDFGATSKERLVKFYKRHGFVENKGKNKDFTVSETMIREPKVQPTQPIDNRVLSDRRANPAARAEYATQAQAATTDAATAQVAAARPIPERIVDLFGNGSRVQYFNDSKGLFFESQKYPNGQTKWRAGEIVDGQEQWLSTKEFSSKEEAQNAVRNLRISNATKANNAKYSDIPNIWKGEERKIAKAMIDAGFGIDRFSSSTQSRSKYIYLDNGVKVRLADHNLPSGYDSPDVEFRYGQDVKTLIEEIKNKNAASAISSNLVGTPTSGMQEQAVRADKSGSPELAQKSAVGSDANNAPETLTSQQAKLAQQSADTGIPPEPSHKDPLIRSVLDRAESLKNTEPDMPVSVREDGTYATVAQEIDAIRKQAQEGTDTTFGAMDADLLQAAADCFLSIGFGAA